jgi:hypothetical protein
MTYSLPLACSGPRMASYAGRETEQGNKSSYSSLLQIGRPCIVT